MEGATGPASRGATSSSLAWFKSSYSSEQGGACLEVAYAWRKSSYRGSDGGNCLEVAAHPSAVHVRDSRNPMGPALTAAPATWSAFAAHVGA
ncbi:DUF397 domain-containing protein [Streptomyces sp. BpilaLS-43]|uniref:DUF397 domain-containing protein n=1 Tax=Streptomyces sp. BpilaLS-43 TaxID=1839778 RepID=UPI000B86A26F|nr:DUF397 domain-containing protein [Streptomyces sp. BpilaLS-43]